MPVLSAIEGIPTTSPRLISKEISLSALMVSSLEHWDVRTLKRRRQLVAPRVIPLLARANLVTFAQALP
jgi:hypothetical protein